MELLVTIPGAPVGKGRPRHTKGGHIYTPRKTKAWEDGARLVFTSSWRHPALSVPCTVNITATHPRPKRLSTQRRAHLPHCPGGGQLPDLDNVVKAVLDALQPGVVTDDRWVVKLSAKAVYGEVAGVTVQVQALG